MNPALTRRIGIGVVCVLVASGVFFGVRRRPTVEVQSPRRAPAVETLVASGRVRPVRRVDVAFDRLGRVVSVAVSEGDRVRAGEVLVQLDDTAARADLDRARAQLDQAEAAIARLRGTSSRIAASDERAAASALEQARTAENRQRDLLTAGATTPEAALAATRAREVAEATHDRATELSSSVARGGGDRRVVDAARAASQADLRAAQAALDDTVLRAPFDGIVLSRRVEPGQIVQPGEALLELASTGTPEVVVHVDEGHLARLRVGQRAALSAEAFLGRSFAARVSALAPAVDPARGTVEVRLEVVEATDVLRTDMTVSVEIETGRAERALVVPSELVRDLATPSPYVFVVHRGELQRRAIRLGLRGDSWVAVVSGLSASDDVVRDATPPAEGSRVRVRRVR